MIGCEKFPATTAETAIDPPGDFRQTGLEGHEVDHGGGPGGRGRLIRHAFLRSLSGLQAPAIGALAVPMVESSFLAGLVTAARRAELIASVEVTAVPAAIALASIATGTDEEEDPAMRRAAKPLAKGSFE